jgi:hypothetical protein
LFVSIAQWGDGDENGKGEEEEEEGNEDEDREEKGEKEEEEEEAKDGGWVSCCKATFDGACEGDPFEGQRMATLNGRRLRLKHVRCLALPVHHGFPPIRTTR